MLPKESENQDQQTESLDLYLIHFQGTLNFSSIKALDDSAIRKRNIQKPWEMASYERWQAGSPSAQEYYLEISEENVWKMGKGHRCSHHQKEKQTMEDFCFCKVCMH